VQVTLDIVFFNEDQLSATRDFEAFVAALQAQPWFLEFQDRPSDPLDDGLGMMKRGISVLVDVTKAEEAKT
jgi:hypothetical protein